MSMLKSKYVHGLRPCNTNVIIISSDFIDYVDADIAIKDVTKINRVIGIGTTLHKFKNKKGKDVFLPCVSYHPPTTYVRPLSP